MKVQETGLPGVLLITPEVHADERGWFLENWRAERFTESGISPGFVQANTSHSLAGMLRGLHYQWPEPQGKLVWVSAGRVIDVAVDIRPDSSTFAAWTGLELSAENHAQVWIPEGFAHGFQVLSESATVCYLCTRPYRSEYDAAIAWNDPDIGIAWPRRPAGLSGKDRRAPRLRDLTPEQLPRCASL